MRTTTRWLGLALLVGISALTTSSALAAQWESANEQAITSKGGTQAFLFGKKTVECSKLAGESGSTSFPGQSISLSAKYSECKQNIVEKGEVTVKCGSWNLEVEEKAETKSQETPGKTTTGACTIEVGTCTIKIPSQKKTGLTYVNKEEGKESKIQLFVLEKAVMASLEYEATAGCTGVEAKGKNGEYTGNSELRGKFAAVPLQVDPAPKFQVTISPSMFLAANQIGSIKIKNISAKNAKVTLILELDILLGWTIAAHGACVREYTSMNECEYALEFTGMAGLLYQMSVGVGDNGGGFAFALASGLR